MTPRAFALAVSLLIVALFLPGTSRAQVPFEANRIEWSSYDSPATEAMEVLRSRADLEALWIRTGRRGTPPDVEFRRQTAVAYLLGVRPTGGYRVELESVRVERGTLTLHFVEIAPGPCCVAGQVSTFPGLFITTIPWKGPVAFERRVEFRNCCP